MATHLLAVLGTSLYEPVIYKDNGFSTDEEYEFVQLAVAEKYKEELKEDGAKITIFVTDFSAKRNYFDREYTENDVRDMGRWKKSRDYVIEGNIKKGLETQFKEQFPELFEKLEYRVIPVGKDSKEIDEIFNTIYDAINPEEEIVFDITHGFRSIPMLTLSVINFAEKLKNCKLKNITYGAFEGAETDEKTGVKTTELVDLTLYSEILNWSDAANAFMRFGNATLMNELITDKVRQNHRIGIDPDWTGVKKITKAADTLSQAIQACRGVDDDALVAMKQKAFTENSIKKAYREYRKTVEKNDEDSLGFTPMKHLFDKTKESFSVFDKQKNYEIGLSVVEWSLDNGMIQQGYTALEESIKTFLCDFYDFDEVDENVRDGMMGACMKYLATLRRNKKSEFTREEAIANVDFCDSNWKVNMSDKEKACCINLMEIVSLDFVDVASNVRDFRNDINHFGMRQDPQKASKLKSSLKENYEKTIKYIEEMRNFK